MRERADRHLLHGKPSDLRQRLRLAYAHQHVSDCLTQAVLITQIQANAAYVGFVADIGRQDLQCHGKAHVARCRKCFVFGGSHSHCAHHRNTVRRQHGFGFKLVKHVAAFSQRFFYDRSRCGQVWRPVLADSGNLQQQILVCAVSCQHGKGANRLFRCGVIGHTRCFKDVPRLGHRRVAQPAGHHAAWRLLRNGRARAGNVVASHDSRRCVHEEHRAAVRVSEQRFQRLGVALDRCVADDVNRVRV